MCAICTDGDNYQERQNLKPMKNQKPTIGDTVTITDPKSLVRGKAGVVTGQLGNMLTVTILENGEERTVLVSPSGAEVNNII